MYASTKVLVAGPLSWLSPSAVARVSLIPPTVTVVLALMLTWPAWADVKLKVQLPAGVVHITLAGRAFVQLLHEVVHLTALPTPVTTSPLPTPPTPPPL